MIKKLPNPFEDGKCFFCGPDNPSGLKLTFFHDSETGQTFTDYTPEATYCGQGDIFHGGMQMGLLDETMWWAAYAVTGEEFAVTVGASFRFLRPVFIGEPVRVVCVVKEREGASIRLSGRIENAAGKPCTTVRGEYRVVSPERYREMLSRQEG